LKYITHVAIIHLLHFSLILSFATWSTKPLSKYAWTSPTSSSIYIIQFIHLSQSFKDWSSSSSQFFRSAFVWSYLSLQVFDSFFRRLDPLGIWSPGRDEAGIDWLLLVSRNQAASCWCFLAWISRGNLTIRPRNRIPALRMPLLNVVYY
jgi:hypothetical protein